jgi:hypothetical protein
MNALEQLIEFLNYDYRQLAIVLLSVEQREGRGRVDQLLEDIQGPKTKTNAKHFVTRLRELVEAVEGDQEPESRKPPRSMAGRS